MANQNPTGNPTTVLSDIQPNTSLNLYEATLLEGFYDPDGDSLKVANILADSGEISEITLSQWTYVPDKDTSNMPVTLYYTVTDTKGGDVQSALNFKILAKQTPPTGNVTISGTAQPNQTLTASDTLADANGINSSKTYQWLSDGTIINGATATSYTLSNSDAGKSISVNVSYTDGLGKLESMSSRAVTVGQAQTPTTGNVKISGTASVGNVLSTSLTADKIKDPLGVNEVTYQWYNNDFEIEGATESRYTVTPLQGNISLKVSYSTNTGKVITLVSSPVDIATGVAISGIGDVGETLTAVPNLNDAQGVNSLRYQWYADNKKISGATDETYLVSNDDEGKNITVYVTYYHDDDQRRSDPQTYKSYLPVHIGRYSQIWCIGNFD
jgi:hypothetical protein